MSWVSRMIRNRQGWRALHGSARDDDDDGLGRTVNWYLADDNDWHRGPSQDDYGRGYRGWSEDLSRQLRSHDPGQRAIE